jgi:hypothetical protein
LNYGSIEIQILIEFQNIDKVLLFFGDFIFRMFGPIDVGHGGDPNAPKFLFGWFGRCTG